MVSDLLFKLTKQPKEVKAIYIFPAGAWHFEMSFESPFFLLEMWLPFLKDKLLTCQSNATLFLITNLVLNAAFICFHQLLTTLACKSSWHFLFCSKQINIFNIVNSVLDKLAMIYCLIVSYVSWLALPEFKIMLPFTFLGAGVVSEVIQVAFPVAASVPSLLQTYQQSRYNQKRGRGKGNIII